MTRPDRVGALPAQAPPARAPLGASPPADPVRWQPLLSAALITVLWGNGLRVLDLVLVPGPWSGQSLLIAALTLGAAGVVRTVWPDRVLVAVVLGLVAGAAPTALAISSTTGLAPWYAAPFDRLGEGSAAIRQGVAPLEATPAVASVVVLVSLLLAWACALMSAGSGDVVGASGFIPAGTLLIPGLVVGQPPPAQSALAAAVCLVLLVGSAAPAAPRYAGLPLGARVGRALVRAGGRACVLAVALGLAAGALRLAPATPDQPRRQEPGGSATTPDTSLVLNQDLVRGSTATAFEYGGDGFPGGTSLRFTLAVVRDLDGESWDPLTETEGVTALSHLTTSTGAHALTAGGAMASAGAPSDQLPRILVRVRALTSRRLPLLQSTALVGPAGDDGAAADPTDPTLSPEDWQWVTGTGTAISTGAPTQPGTAFTAYGWSAVADAAGRPQASPPVGAAAPDAAALAPYTSPPGESRAVRDAAAEAVGAAGADGADSATRAAALAAWFHGNGFVYDESAPGGFDGDGADGPGASGASGTASGSPTGTVETFLTERRGFCVHYSAAFTLMARSLGIPTRIAIGYASRTGDEGAMTAVSGRDLHAWPEVWVDDVGWVAFEPTPGGAGARADAAPAEAPSADAPSAEAPREGAASPDPAAPSATAEPEGAGPAGAGSDSAAGGGARPCLLVLVLPVAGVLVAACPGALRWWQRRRRRREAAAGDAPACAAWEEVMATAVDLGLLGRRPGGPRPGEPPGGGPRARTPEAIAEYLSGLMSGQASGPAATPGRRAAGGADEPQPPSAPPAARALEELAAQVVAERFSLRAELSGQVGNEWRVGRKKSRNRNDSVTALDRIRVALVTCASRRRRLIALLAPRSVMPHRWRA